MFESIATQLQLNERGRAVLRLLTATVLAGAVLLIGALLATVPGFFGGQALATGTVDASAGDGTVEYITVGEGDSLWGIASEVSPETDPRDTMLVIAELNSLDSGELHPGQQIAVPAGG
ncbi:LysM peptidoglycan-binding domain-containing protein [Sediminivirga luteola]|jgi:hypothetical protein|uniref:LysM domain-containing protein n=1 Tax=Sediminivirga luteola TaxID=1774748 RepID=A0A8J2XF43_9MICO|nr:LysM peptidoglycan-binding domain-containing protein [Sediminivirga luteola]MCI2266412.1 LysM peptidoglycan-binding domain-containing protein [Sediminivirga luteola]GGA11727.1 hypothetical protein GCM10011333_13240 [Sediminivirga luteola]